VPCTNSCIPVPGLEETRPVDFSGGQCATDGPGEGGIKAVFDEESVGFPLVLADIDDVGVGDKDTAAQCGEPRLVFGEELEVQIDGGHEESNVVVFDDGEQAADVAGVGDWLNDEGFVAQLKCGAKAGSLGPEE
jgi:hypothetical protein